MEEVSDADQDRYREGLQWTLDTLMGIGLPSITSIIVTVLAVLGRTTDAGSLLQHKDGIIHY